MVGDACCAAFSTAPDAVKAAAAAQLAIDSEPWPDGYAVKVRMALHTGACEERDGDYFGQPVNRVARLLSAGHGGQVLLSAATQELVRDKLPEGVTLVDLGDHRLKDLIRPEHVFQATIAGLDADFPTLRSLGARPTNLPIQATPFIGREKEVAEVCELLRQSEARLVTLTGPAGTGKTRLSLQAGADLLDDFADGVFFVSLAPISDAGLVIPTMAATLHLRESGGTPLVDVIASYLQQKEMLLILDNFEHVTEAAEAVGEVSRQAPGVKMLVTSRTPLQLYGERRYAVPAMTVPDGKNLPPLDHLSHYESVALFIQRAKEVKQDFAVTNETAPALAEICARLDGLPLAIELAAARVSMLPLPAILDRLSNRLKLLTTGAKDLPARQRTLRGAIEWSYDLLSEPDQRLFGRLSIFVDGWTLDAADAVCNEEGDIDVFEGTASLVEKNLVRAVDGAQPRFSLLQTMQEFGRDQAAAELPVLRARHAEYFLTLADANYRRRREEGPQVALELAPDFHNLTSAVTYLLEVNRRPEASRVVGSMYPNFLARGAYGGAREAIEQVLPAPGSETVDDIPALTYLGRLSSVGVIVSFERAAAALEAALRLAREAGDAYQLATCLHAMSVARASYGKVDEGERCLLESLELCERFGFRSLGATVRYDLSCIAFQRGQFDESIKMRRSTAEEARGAGDYGLCLRVMSDLTGAYLYAGDALAATEAGHEALGVAAELAAANQLTHVGWPVYIEMYLGLAECFLGEFATGMNRLRTSLREHQRLNIDLGSLLSCQCIAMALAKSGALADAARIWSGCATWVAEAGLRAAQGDVLLNERELEAARTQSESDAWQRSWDEGSALTPEAVVAFALNASIEQPDRMAHVSSPRGDKG